MNTKKVIAAVVTFHPQNDALERLILATQAQVHEIIIVDNTPQHDFEFNQHKEAHINFIHLADNMGIAYAQNIAIQYAIEREADFILMLDQDSVPEPRMVNTLVEKFCHLSAQGHKVAMTAPVNFDARTQLESPFLTLRYGYPVRQKRTKSQSANRLIETCFLISSGSLISIDAIKKIGGNRSGYFIDHVDTEWCLRAMSANYQLYGVYDARLMHAIGDHAQVIPFFKSRQISYHAPYRDYYMFRNTIFCIKNIQGIYKIKLFLLLRLLYFFVYFLVFAPYRWLRTRMMLLGLWHGFRSIDGKLVSDSTHCLPIPKTNIETF